MTLTTEPTTAIDSAALAASARDHLWMHFTRMSAYQQADVPVITRGEGPYIWDARGKRYLDGLAGLFVVQAGHGRVELAQAAAKQAQELAFFPLWSYAHPQAATGCSSPPVVARPSSRPGRWPSSTSSSPASR